MLPVSALITYKNVCQLFQLLCTLLLNKGPNIKEKGFLAQIDPDGITIDHEALVKEKGLKSAASPAAKKKMLGDVTNSRIPLGLYKLWFGNMDLEVSLL